MELKRHLVFEHGIKDGALICDICPKAVFFMKYHYNKHMDEKHAIKIVEKENWKRKNICKKCPDKSKDQPCKECCGKVFKKKDSLKIHLKRNHTVAQKTHLCKTCKKCFGDYELLKNHVFQSDNQQNCSQCSAKRLCLTK